MAVSTADITVGTATGTGITALTTTAFTITSNANRGGLLGISIGSDASTITGSIGQVAAVTVAGSDSTTTNSQARSLIMRVLAPPSGSRTGTFSMSLGPANAGLGAEATSGVDQTNGMNNGTFRTGTSVTATVTVTSTNGDLTHDTIASADGAISAPTQTQQWSVVGNNMNAGGSSGPGTGTTTHQWTIAGSVSGWAYSGANYIAAAGGAAATVIKLTLKTMGSNRQRWMSLGVRGKTNRFVKQRLS